MPPLSQPPRGTSGRSPPHSGRASAEGRRRRTPRGARRTREDRRPENFTKHRQRLQVVSELRPPRMGSRRACTQPCHEAKLTEEDSLEQLVLRHVAKDEPPKAEPANAQLRRQRTNVEQPQDRAVRQLATPPFKFSNIRPLACCATDEEVHLARVHRLQHLHIVGQKRPIDQAREQRRLHNRLRKRLGATPRGRARQRTP